MVLLFTDRWSRIHHARLLHTVMVDRLFTHCRSPVWWAILGIGILFNAITHWFI